MRERKQIDGITAAITALAPAKAERHTDRAQPEPKGLPLVLRARRALSVSAARTARAVAARRAFPIMAYVGPNGGGKSLAMVADTLPSLDVGRTVISTVALLDADGNPHPSCVRFTDWDQLLDARDCDILMDEMVGIAGARESARLDPRIQNILVQLRRRNIVLRWSAPNWARADKIVREVTQSVTECRGFYADRRVVRADGADDAVALWAPKRLFSFRTFDTLDFEEWSAGKREKLEPTVSEWFYGPGSRAFWSYNTLDAVTMVVSNDNGRCSICDGTIAAKRCRGHDDDVIAAFEAAMGDPAEDSTNVEHSDTATPIGVDIDEPVHRGH